MRINYIIMAAMTVVLLGLALYFRGVDKTGEGIKRGLLILWDIWPLLLLAVIVAGLLGALIPPRIVSSYLGNATPYRGILIAWIIAACCRAPLTWFFRWR